MARGINKVILVGNCGNEPEQRFMNNGSAVTRVSVATSESWKEKDSGERRERTEWHRVVFFGRLAEIAKEYLRKGSKVYVEGSLRTSSYEKDGIKRYSTEIIASDMQMLDSRNSADQGMGGGGGYAADDGWGQQGGGAGSSAPREMEPLEDEIPF